MNEKNGRRPATGTDVSRLPASPCVGICQLGVLDQVCLGCGRHIDEIAAWDRSSSEQQQAIIDQARKRLARWQKPEES